MKTYPKIQVIFPLTYPLDFDELVEVLKANYRVGYAGLFFMDSKSSASLVLQTLPNESCMALGKIEKICRPYVQGQLEVTPFRSFQQVSGGWELLQQQGRFRAWGGHRCSKQMKRSKQPLQPLQPRQPRQPLKPLQIQPREPLYLHINALGEEDVEHITAKDLDNLVGTEDDVINFFERNYTANAKQTIMMREWEKFRAYSREKVRRWDQQSDDGGLCDRYGIPSEEPPLFSDSDTEDELEEREELEELAKMKDPPTYDPDSDSEGNLERKKKLLRTKLIDRAPKILKDDFLKEFQCLILDNPHNSNVVANTRDGYFRYFDGKRWIKAYNKDFFEKVTLSRISKATEMLNKQSLLGCREFTRSQVSSMVTRLLRFGQGSEVDLFLRDNTEAVKDGILAAENQESRLALAERALKRRIIRVGKDEANVKGRRVVSNSTWEKLKV